MEEVARKRREKLLALKNGAINGEPIRIEKRPLEEDPEEVKKSTNTVEAAAVNLQEEIDQKQQEILTEEVDLTSLIPKKVDWDLKRDLEPKLAKLERQTRRRIVELIRIRVNENKEQNKLRDSVLADRINTRKEVGTDSEED